MFLGWFPRPLRPLARPAISAVMDEPLLDAFGFPRPSPALRRLVEGAMRLRGRAVGWLPARRRPVIRTELKHRSYPHGWRIEDLGPPGADPVEPDGVASDGGDPGPPSGTRREPEVPQ
jgi:hypothetical protein